MGYIKQSVPPDELKVLFDAFNALPAETEEILKEISEDQHAAMLRIYESTDFSDETAAAKAMQAINEENAHKLMDRLVTPEVAAALSPGSYTNYWFLANEIRWLLYDHGTLAGVVKAYWTNRDSIFGLENNPKIFRFTEDGRVVSASRILEILGRVPVERIRICKICGLVFWAKKSNAWTCSPECATALGNQKKAERRKGSI